MRIIILFFMLNIIYLSYSQSELNGKIITSTFHIYHSPIIKKRKVLSLKGKSFLFKINPLTYLAAGSLYVYQNVFSEQISANCTYQISCSEYTKKCIEKYGLVKGSVIGLHQLSNCIAGNAEQHCEYKISKSKKIINEIK